MGLTTVLSVELGKNMTLDKKKIELYEYQFISCMFGKFNGQIWETSVYKKD